MWGASSTSAQRRTQQKLYVKLVENNYIGTGSRYALQSKSTHNAFTPLLTQNNCNLNLISTFQRCMYFFIITILAFNQDQVCRLVLWRARCLIKKNPICKPTVKHAPLLYSHCPNHGSILQCLLSCSSGSSPLSHSSDRNRTLSTLVQCNLTRSIEGKGSRGAKHGDFEQSAEI